MTPGMIAQIHRMISIPMLPRVIVFGVPRVPHCGQIIFPAGSVFPLSKNDPLIALKNAYKNPAVSKNAIAILTIDVSFMVLIMLGLIIRRSVEKRIVCV